MHTKNKFLTTGLLLLCLSITDHSYADFEFGAQYYEQQQYEKAYKEFLEAAQFGDPDAQYNLGAMYYRGEFVTKDIPTAYAWFALAAQANFYKEKSLHTKIYEKLGDSDKIAAEKKYSEIFNLYNSNAITNKLTPSFIGSSREFQDVRSFKKVSPKYPQVMLQKGRTGFVDITFTIDKNGITKDHLVIYSSSKSFEKEAIKALRKFQYRPMTVHSIPVEVNGFKTRHRFLLNGKQYDNNKIDEAVNELRDKAMKGIGSDMLNFAYFLEAIPSFTSDYKIKDNPNEWYVKASNQGSAAASYFLGRNILYGNMCTQDNVQSMGWLLKAAKQGISDAQYMLAIESFSGARFEKNEEKAFYWLKKAAANSKAAKIKYSWILSTHPVADKRNVKLALEYINSIDDDYYDKQSFFQAHAAIAAENGDFKSAIKWQEKAIKDAIDLELPLESLQARMTAYENKKAWREEI